MNEIARIKNEVKLKQWVEMIRCRNESGLTVAECCRQNGAKDVLLSVKTSETECI